MSAQIYGERLKLSFLLPLVTTACPSTILLHLERLPLAAKGERGASSLRCSSSRPAA